MHGYFLVTISQTHHFWLAAVKTQSAEDGILYKPYITMDDVHRIFQKHTARSARKQVKGFKLYITNLVGRLLLAVSGSPPVQYPQTQDLNTTVVNMGIDCFLSFYLLRFSCMFPCRESSLTKRIVFPIKQNQNGTRFKPPSPTFLVSSLTSDATKCRLQTVWPLMFTIHLLHSWSSKGNL